MPVIIPPSGNSAQTRVVQKIDKLKRSREKAHYRVIIGKRMLERAGIMGGDFVEVNIVHGAIVIRPVHAINKKGGGRSCQSQN